MAGKGGPLRVTPRRSSDERRPGAARVVGAAGSIRLAVEGKDDRVDAPAGCAKQMIVGLHDAVGVGQQILGILAPRGPSEAST